VQCVTKIPSPRGNEAGAMVPWDLLAENGGMAAVAEAGWATKGRMRAREARWRPFGETIPPRCRSPLQSPVPKASPHYRARAAAATRCKRQALDASKVVYLESTLLWSQYVGILLIVVRKTLMSTIWWSIFMKFRNKKPIAYGRGAEPGLLSKAARRHAGGCDPLYAPC
jgi:hypothetical protein